MTEENVSREKEFHNKRFGNSSTHSRGERYPVTNSVHSRLLAYLRRHSEGARVLELGCGLSRKILSVADAGGAAFGIDISEAALKRVVAMREPERLSPQLALMDAHRLGLASNSFDLAYGTGVLHHLRLRDVLGELRRVLVPGGEAVFIEPLGHNPLINLYRQFTPNLRSQDEHPFLVSDLDQLSAFFEKVELDFYYLTSISALLLGGLPGGDHLFKLFEALDQRLLKVPALQRYAWIVFIHLSVPCKFKRG
jgi:SAM-dependent methyltransferase